MNFRPLARLAVTNTAASAVLLQSSREQVELRVLADDLFRLRIVRGKTFSVHPSWAVAKTHWAAAPTRVRSTARHVSLETRAGQLKMRQADGSWQLRDARGRLQLSAGPAATGFAGRQARVTLDLAGGESLFGLGETAGPLNQRGRVREFWNLDVLGHASCIHPGLRSLYVSIPFAVTLRDGRAAGLFWDNPAKQVWDMGQTAPDEWRLSAASGELDLYLFPGPEAGRIVERYTELTGRMPLPPRWALGYHQSRYSYKSRAEVERLAREFRRRKIPCDALYLDIDYMRGHRVFTFGKNFPRPAEMIARLRRQGFKVVTIVDPGVKNDPTFGVLRRGRALDAFVKAPGGRRDFIGKVWPGNCRFPDFLNETVRRWWGREQGRFQRLGAAGFWNDMNEPAVFDGPGKTMPLACVHEMDLAGRVRHAAAHNLYGLAMARASFEGALAHAPDQRPFIISRAGYAGIQRYATVWTGDNSSTWEQLAGSVPMLLNLSLSGVAFCGADVGGFLDNAEGELLARWTQLAAFTPFFRNHCNKDACPQEPWAFGQKIEAICKRSIELRYRLLPYLETLFAEAHQRGTPIIRPLFYHYQDDPVAVGVGDQFLLGRDLLVAPVLQPGAVARCVYLPRGEWVNFWSRRGRHRGGRHIVARAPLDTIPLFIRAGAKILLAPVRQFIS